MKRNASLETLTRHHSDFPPPVTAAEGIILSLFTSNEQWRWNDTLCSSDCINEFTQICTRQIFIFLQHLHVRRGKVGEFVYAVTAAESIILSSLFIERKQG